MKPLIVENITGEEANAAGAITAADTASTESSFFIGESPLTYC
ncbi:conserved hypothetical protein [Vibrio chagasii]|nr:conserved hypothetical protein [Vibrio chagasii]CAK1940461.1 hypothetical protein VCRA2119O432_260019 [Vibrio crassostreae]CAH6816847.1 conserved hypothetical protein [Vibrio chagasii]CAH6873815.1 conserved hypothetical protein [Vibrio chagasii]CAH6905694.1 conserved hypothetical protein [Vibrio chagasii]